jgi:predicted O-methyltransferase YrrM
VSRQSISQRDAGALKIEKEAQLVLIEGDDKALERAKELFKDLGSVEEGQMAVDIYSKFKEDEEGAAASVGFIFGD